ncbi:MAG: tRNA-uridine aminocarboxypropyltransferase [Planctomycetota bacterium]
MNRAPDPLRHPPLLDAADDRISPERARLLAHAQSLLDDLLGRRTPASTEPPATRGAALRLKGLRLGEFGAALLELGKINEARKCHARGASLLLQAGETAALERLAEKWRRAGVAATPPICERCRLDLPLCLCGDVRRIETRTRFVILRHEHESRRRTNSARIAALAMTNCELADRAERDSRMEFEPPPGAWVLYPGADPLPEGAPGPATVVVIDGTWRESKRMFLRVPALQHLPRLSLPPHPPTARLRTGPSFGMATLESIAHAVERLEGAEAARPLHELFELFVERSQEGARRAGRRVLK